MFKQVVLERTPYSVQRATTVEPLDVEVVQKHIQLIPTERSHCPWSNASSELGQVAEPASKYSHSVRSMVVISSFKTRARKVKCDEGRPACQRCVSARRMCEGYGVWGGGGGDIRSKCAKPSAGAESEVALLPNITPISVIPLQSAVERDCFEWFLCRTATKLPGPFQSPFFQTLLLQSSLHEPAVMHAVLALGSLHMREEKGILVHLEDGVPDMQEQFVLSHYSKAIGHLVTRHAGKDKSSVRVALISCLVFTFIELLRGHYETAQVHLRNGLKLVGDTFGSPSAPGDNTVMLRSTGDWVSDSISKAFSRMNVQVELFGPSTPTHSSALLTIEQLPTIRAFKSVEQARERLDYLLNEAIHLTGESPQQLLMEPSGYVASLGRQQRVRSGLTSWLKACENSTEALQTTARFPDAFAFRLLHVYHTMTGIITETALDTSTEALFDNHTAEFASIIEQVTTMRSLIGAVTTHKETASPFTADMGWIPPLYYTALKCRVSWIRVRAIKLLHSVPHREGIWDARMAARIAQKIIGIEEGGFYQGAEVYMSPQDPLRWQPPLPESSRIKDVQVQLPNHSTGLVALTYRKREEDGIWKTAKQTVYVEN